MNEMWEGALFPLAQFGERVWWKPLQPSNRHLGPLDSRFEQGRYWGPMDGSNTVLVGTASGVVKARTIKRLPPGERWTGSLLDEAQGSELAPNELEDDGGRVGLRAPVLQPHAAAPWVPEFRQVRRAPLRRPDFEQFWLHPGCANARAGRKQAVDHSEQCRSRMEANLMTTTEGHERPERACDRFTKAPRNLGWRSPSASDIALRAKGGSLPRHRHLPWCSRGSEATTWKVKAVAVVCRCCLRLRHRHLNHRRLQNEVWNRKPK